ncbi:hypothetical protein AX16_002864 [Volvariella volvacea WC 439]|nr:hypothetical protein AX16_002864 [Volvariella volvacea WC 439]
MAEHRPYNGSQRRLVLAFEIGTTFSHVSYCLLNPGNPPEIRNVSRFPAQEGVGGEPQIPSIILYGPGGEVRAVGAEVEEMSCETIETEHLFRSQWFKLHMRPRHLHGYNFNFLPPLPPGKNVVAVFADYLRYLFKCSKEFIIQSHIDGAQIWESKKNIILTHPNGWENAQQALMREAAIIAGVIPNTPEGRESIHFVTDGEAILHFCLSRGLAEVTLCRGDTVLVVDAGRGTIDISNYKKTGDASLFEEAAAPQCHLRGSVFVTQSAKTFLYNFLQGSRYHDVVEDIAECFDKRERLKFRDKHEPVFIKFGTMRDRDPEYNIRSGQLKLAGEDVARFFEPSIACISGAIKEAKQVKAVFLVGEFSASDWVINSLQEKFEQSDIIIYRPDHCLSKIVSKGAITVYLNLYAESQGIDNSPRSTNEASEHQAASMTERVEQDIAQRNHLISAEYSSGHEEIQRLREELRRKEKECEEKDKSIQKLQSDWQLEVTKSSALQQANQGLEEMIKTLHDRIDQGKDRLKSVEMELDTARRNWEAEGARYAHLAEIEQKKFGDVQKQLTEIQEMFNRTTKSKDKEVEEKMKMIQTLHCDLQLEARKSAALKMINQGLLELVEVLEAKVDGRIRAPEGEFEDG